MHTSTTGGLTMIKEMLASLPPSERKIANYILKHPDTAVLCTTGELGERTNTSGAAVIRLCKSLGLKGFQDLKIRIAGDLQKPKQEGYRDIHPHESQSEVLSKMTSNSVQAITETEEMLNPDALARAVEAILSARRIHFFGVGASSIIALDAQQKFLRINKEAVSFSDIHMAAMHVANLTEDDVVMGISFSGQTEEVVKLIDLANEKRATTISLTKYGTTSVSERASIRLFTSASKEAVFRSAATSSRLAQLHVIDILYMCVASEEYEDSIKWLDQTRQAIHFLGSKSNKKQGGKDGHMDS
ncbi:MurR/RpiR family transcriptional regulator [Caldalkalibacillus salinus]|uniref:MurR/RpiR family transcriptional regulator n=1 Tax=Caldalkalibacillus salinus TaxID=2803787 RepID=UPI001F1ACC07|nr:MurR/RpiR family transcriptional regulator [Caldalkalibacillus salinus]